MVVDVFVRLVCALCIVFLFTASERSHHTVCWCILLTLLLPVVTVLIVASHCVFPIPWNCFRVIHFDYASFNTNISIGSKFGNSIKSCITYSDSEHV